MRRGITGRYAVTEGVGEQVRAFYLSLYLKQHREEYYRLLDLVRAEVGLGGVARFPPGGRADDGGSGGDDGTASGGAVRRGPGAHPGGRAGRRIRDAGP